LNGLDRDDLVDEPPLIDRLDRLPVRIGGPLIHLFPGDVRQLRGVPADGERHVGVRRIDAVGVGWREPRVDPVVRSWGSPLADRRGRTGLDTSGDDGAVHAGVDRCRGHRDSRQACGAVPIHREAGDGVHAVGEGGMPGDDAAAIHAFTEDDIVNVGGRNTAAFE
jgi:hypothetical protein